ncbi:GNAT family N-acetyltransferase [Bacillus thuringiensis]|nr:GNAT family N-acetyltransferase [Bacillus thuringiensis]
MVQNTDSDKNFEYHISNDTWCGYINDTMVAEFDYYEDDNGRKWINQMYVNNKFQRRGIGSHMIKLAVQEYGEVYASSGSKMDGSDDDSDTRYLSNEGASLINSCIKKGIMKKEWLLNPYFSYEDDDDFLEEEFSQEELDYLRKEYGYDL